MATTSNLFVSGCSTLSTCFLDMPTPSGKCFCNRVRLTCKCDGMGGTTRRHGNSTGSLFG
jgi:hypothetical protein